MRFGRSAIKKNKIKTGEKVNGAQLKFAMFSTDIFTLSTADNVHSMHAHIYNIILTAFLEKWTTHSRKVFARLK